MRRSLAMVAAALTLGLGLIAAAPAEAGGKNGPKHGFKHGYGHGYGQGYGQGYAHGAKHGAKHRHVRRDATRWTRRAAPHRYHRHPRRHGGDGDRLLAAVGIIAGAKVAAAYLQGPPVQETTVIYAAPPQPRTCYQVMVPYPNAYGGYTYAPQLQCQ
jgi:hypothetical protein